MAIVRVFAEIIKMDNGVQAYD